MKKPQLVLVTKFEIKFKYFYHNLLKRSLLSKWIRSVLFINAEITLYFVDIYKGRQLNHMYRGFNYPTNVLTFSYNEITNCKLVISDIILCCPVIDHEAKIQGKLLQAHYAHLIIHGILHAQGYTHNCNRTAQKMEKIEINALQYLGFSNPYLI